MLRNYNAAVTLAAKDMAKSHEFYTKVLGLVENQVDAEGLSELSSGSTKIFLYQSGSSNEGTVCTWFVGKEFDEIIGTLQKAGVVFEHYDGMPGLERNGDVHTLVDIRRRVVWFKDPSGNILSITTE